MLWIIQASGQICESINFFIICKKKFEKGIAFFLFMWYNITVVKSER